MFVICLRVVGRIVQASRFPSHNGAVYNQVRYFDDVAKLQNLGCNLCFFVVFLGFLLEELDSPFGPLKSQVTAYNSDVITHDLLGFSFVVRNKNPLFRVYCSAVIPVGERCVVSECLNGFPDLGVGPVSEDKRLKQ